MAMFSAIADPLNPASAIRWKGFTPSGLVWSKKCRATMSAACAPADLVSAASTLTAPQPALARSTLVSRTTSASKALGEEPPGGVADRAVVADFFSDGVVVGRVVAGVVGAVEGGRVVAVLEGLVAGRGAVALRGGGERRAVPGAASRFAVTAGRGPPRLARASSRA